MEISTDYPLLWKSIRNFHIFSWVEIFLRIFWQPFLLGIFPQNFLLCGNLFLIFQEKIIKIFHNFSRVDLFHKIVVANHAMLRKFQTPSKSVWGRISTFLMSAHFTLPNLQKIKLKYLVCWCSDMRKVEILPQTDFGGFEISST